MYRESQICTLRNAIFRGGKKLPKGTPNVNRRDERGTLPIERLFRWRSDEGEGLEKRKIFEMRQKNMHEFMLSGFSVKISSRRGIREKLHYYKGAWSAPVGATLTSERTTSTDS